MLPIHDNSHFLHPGHQDCYKYVGDATTITTNSGNNGHLDYLYDYTNPVKFSAILKKAYTGSDGFNSLLAVSSVTGDITTSSSLTMLTMGAYTSTIGLGYYNGGLNNFVSSNRSNHTQPNDTEYLMEIEINSSNQITSKITRLSDNTVLFNDTRTLPITLTGYKFGVFNRGKCTTTYRDVKIKPL